MKQKRIVPFVAALVGGWHLVGCAGPTAPPVMNLAPTTEGQAARHDIHPHTHDLGKAPVAPQHVPTSRLVQAAKTKPDKAKPNKPGHPAPTPTPTPTPTPPSAPASTLAIDARLLIITAAGQEACLPAIKQALDYMGTPYTVWTATERPGGLTPEALATGDHGHYQGVILTTGNLAFFDGATWLSALNADEWAALEAYQARFGVRQVTWYTLPTADYGFGPAQPVDTTTSPVQTSFTAAGRAVFPYLAANASVTIQDAYTYLAPPADASLTPLLTDAAGHTLAGVKRYADGRENLALTFDTNQHLVHSLSLSYGLVNWVTKGVFVGDRQVYLGAQVDDYFIPDDMWGGGEFRMKATDLAAVVAWQTARRTKPTMRDFKLDMVYNALGAEDPKDPLTALSKLVQSQFKWINHTYTHENLDALSYTASLAEFQKNIDAAQALKLGAFTRENLVTPQISGLYNPEAMRAAFDSGVRFMVSDTSRPNQNNPVPNHGIHNPHQPSILMIPRYPNNLFYNVSTPEEWAGEYNSFHRGYWGRDLTYAEILDKESDVLVRYLLKGDMNPLMFHQPNLRAYDGRRTLLGDLIDATVAKYERLYNLPILSPTQDELGRRMANRMRAATAGVVATLRPGQSITFTAQRDASVTVTGLKTDKAVQYGGQPISTVSIRAGQALTLPLQ
ncbi:MAG: hypothetical protein ACK46X_13815 [Candidatus Sericytochromatia bacterium]